MITTAGALLSLSAVHRPWKVSPDEYLQRKQSGKKKIIIWGNASKYRAKLIYCGWIGNMKFFFHARRRSQGAIKSDCKCSRLVVVRPGFDALYSMHVTRNTK